MIGASTCDKSHEDLSLRRNSQTMWWSIASAVSQVVQRAVDQAPSRLPITSTSATSSSSATSISTTSSTSTSTSQELGMLMCSLVTRSCCISLETHLVLNSEYIGPFYFFSVLLLSLRMFPADWMMFRQLHKRCVWRISCSVYIFAGWWPVCRCDKQKTHYWSM